MSGERTTLVVSHRLGSARLCDRILVLKRDAYSKTGRTANCCLKRENTPAYGLCKRSGTARGKTLSLHG